MKRENKIRIISFTLCAFFLLGAFAVYQSYQLSVYKNYVQAAYQRSFYDTIDYVKSIDANIEKSIHSSSPDHFAMLSSEIWRQSAAAQSSIAELPLDDVQLNGIKKFLSQVGEYTRSLSQKVTEEEMMTDEEQQTLEDLSSYAKRLTQSFLELEDQISNGNITIGKIQQATLYSQEQVDGFSKTFKDTEEEFAEYPTLLYDGPFSDHIDPGKSLFLDDKTEITMEEGKELAAKFLDVPSSTLKGSEGSGGSLPTYAYHSSENENLAIELTKKGGVPVYLISGHIAKEATVTVEDGLKKTVEFLERNGFTDMKESYFLEENGILTVNYAYVQGEYICYPDLIKIGVALDTGEVVRFESRGYIMNRTERDIPEIGFTKEQCLEKLNHRLTPIEHNLAIIPTSAKEEMFVHGFLCENADGRKYLVYFNTQNGREEEMMMLIESDEGTLAM